MYGHHKPARLKEIVTITHKWRFQSTNLEAISERASQTGAFLIIIIWPINEFILKVRLELLKARTELSKL